MRIGDLTESYMLIDNFGGEVPIHLGAPFQLPAFVEDPNNPQAPKAFTISHQAFGRGDHTEENARVNMNITEDIVLDCRVNGVEPVHERVMEEDSKKVSWRTHCFPEGQYDETVRMQRERHGYNLEVDELAELLSDMSTGERNVPEMRERRQNKNAFNCLPLSPSPSRGGSEAPAASHQIGAEQGDISSGSAVAYDADISSVGGDISMNSLGGAMLISSGTLLGSHSSPRRKTHASDAISISSDAQSEGARAHSAEVISISSDAQSGGDVSPQRNAQSGGDVGGNRLNAGRVRTHEGKQKNGYCGTETSCLISGDATTLLHPHIQVPFKKRYLPHATSHDKMDKHSFTLEPLTKPATFRPIQVLGHSFQRHDGCVLLDSQPSYEYDEGYSDPE